MSASTDPTSTAPSKPVLKRKRVAAAAVLGAVLAITCHFVPRHYQAACHLLASICSGGVR